MQTTATKQMTSQAQRTDRPPARQATRITNVGDTERYVSLGAGGALALLGVSCLARGNLFGLVAGAVGGALAYRGLTGYCHMYQALGLNTSDRHGPETSIPATQGVKVEETITVSRPREELFDFWRNFENLPRIMRHLESVKNTGGQHSHWVARGPFNTRFEWDAEIHNERRPELLAWRSEPGSEVDTAGSVHFTPVPGTRGTVVRVILKYNPPAGKVGAAIARLLGSAPEQEIREDLQQFKQKMEAVNVATTRR